MSIDSANSINSILSEEGSFTTTSTASSIDPLDNYARQLLASNARPYESLSCLLESVPPPSNTPDSASATTSCSSPSITPLPSAASISNNAAGLTLSTNTVSTQSSTATKQLESRKEEDLPKKITTNSLTAATNTAPPPATTPANIMPGKPDNTDSSRIKDKVIQLVTGMGSRFKQQILEIEARKRGGEGKSLEGKKASPTVDLSPPVVPQPQSDTRNINAPTINDLSNDRPVKAIDLFDKDDQKLVQVIIFNGIVYLWFYVWMIF